MTSISENDYKSIIKEADSIFAEKKYDVALMLYEGLIKAFSQKYSINKPSEDDKKQFGNLYIKAGKCATELKKTQYARELYELAEEYLPDNLTIHRALGSLYRKIDPQKTIERYKNCIRHGDNFSFFSSLSWLMLKDSTYSQEDLKREFEYYVNQYRPKYLKLMPAFKHNKRGKRNKKLNIAYVSTDFYCHAMMSFMLPIFENHNQEKYNFTLYAINDKFDKVTERIKATGMKFVDLSKETPQEIAKRIYEDKIDIVIDLAGYVNMKAAWLFYKPAPVQVQYLGFLNTYGMKEVDYIIADKYSIPPDMAKYYTETPLYVPHWMQKFCFSHPNTNLPPVKEEPPCVKNGYITFGSFNTVSKIDDYTIYMWSKILEAVPNSHLLFYRTQMDDEDIARFTTLLTKYNVDMSRIEFKNEKRKDSHFNIYSHADVALDPMPFSGLTVSVETMLMGVPVLSLCRDTLQSKGTSRLNLILGLKEFVAFSEEEYLQNAINIADKNLICRFRKQLRPYLFGSPIFTNYEQIAADFEAAYDYAWQQYLDN